MKGRGINRVNYWKQQVNYDRRSSAQSFLLESYKGKNTVMAASDCSCNCYGGCSCTSD